jgi:ribosomal protein S18 acetylase RimI-like enzyme
MLSFEMINVEVGNESDLDSLIGMERARRGDDSKSRLISDSILRGHCLVGRVDGVVAGYAIYNREFFGEAFIWQLLTSPDYRRIGVATSLIRYVELNCRSNKLFTSTNQSNKKMQALMDKLGFCKSGYLDNLDEGDPEIFYFKKLVQIRQSS